jgi:hypothetical protein
VGDRLDKVRLPLIQPIFAAPGREPSPLTGIDNAARALLFQALSESGIDQDSVRARLLDLVQRVSEVEMAVLTAIETVGAELAGLDVGGFEGLLEPFRAVLDEALAKDTWSDFKDALQVAFNAFAETLADRVRSETLNFAGRFSNAAAGLHATLFPTPAELAIAIGELFADRRVQDAVDALSAVAALQNIHVRDELERLQDAFKRSLAELIKRLGMLIPSPPLINLPFGLNAIRLLRAFGDPPRVPNLSFPPLPNPSLPSLPNLPALSCGYYMFDPAKLRDLPSVNLTPIVAKANELAKDLSDKALQAIEIQLPTTELLDRFTPASIENFDLARLFPNFAGLKLEALFAGLRPPAVANDRVRVTHGVDPQSKTGWVQVDVDIPITEPTTVFDLGGVTLRLLKAQFQATTRIDAGVGSTPRQTSRGSITGDWDLQIGGFPIAVLSSCALEFEEGGRISFNVSPDRVRLQQVLAFLADLMSKFGYSSEGFSIAVGPEGVRAVLDLPLPDIQTGVFGITNLRLGFMFALNVAKSFQITTQLSVARKQAPFTLTIFVLGGAGWLEMGVRYVPTTGSFDTFVSIGIMASASLAIALGPIRGGVYVYFGITVDYAGSNTQASHLTVGVLLLFVGEVSLLGIISVGLRLGLEAQYTSDGGLKGRGFVSLSIKICWFITINVQASVEYTFGSAPGTHTLAATRVAALEGDSFSYEERAEEYIRMFAVKAA